MTNTDKKEITFSELATALEEVAKRLRAYPVDITLRGINARLWLPIYNYDKEEVRSTFVMLQKALNITDDPYVTNIGRIELNTLIGPLHVEVSADAKLITEFKEVEVTRTKYVHTYNGKMISEKGSI